MSLLGMRAHCKKGFTFVNGPFACSFADLVSHGVTEIGKSTLLVVKIHIIVTVTWGYMNEKLYIIVLHGVREMGQLHIIASVTRGSKNGNIHIITSLCGVTDIKKSAL